MEENSLICATVLIGLPGSGKTTFCHQFLKNHHSFNSIHFCYDEFIEFKFTENNTIDYKFQRKIMLEEIENCIKYIQENHKIPIKFQKYSKFSNDNRKFVILIDDNNYYRGMRYEFMQLARKLRISFAQIYFQCTQELAKVQNSSRESSIPDEIIEKMNQRLERPLSNNWEQNTALVLQSGGSVNYEEIYNFLNHRFQVVEYVQVIEKNSISQSEIHNIDLKLRKAIGNILKGGLKSSNGNIRTVSQKLNEKRKSILKDLKSGLIQLESDDSVDNLNEIIELLRLD